MARSKEQHSGLWIALAAAVACAAAAGSCRVDIPEGTRFPCQSAADCGGSPAVCMPRSGSVIGVCCFPSPELCDGQDNDCSGYADDGIAPKSCYDGPEGTAEVGICRSGQSYCLLGGQFGSCVGQILPEVEACNGLDENCNGSIDEGLTDSDPNNCGGCGTKCLSTQQCKSGKCVPSSESSCGDKVDEDVDGLTDCTDPDCNLRTCGAGCTCISLQAAERNCEDKTDNDGNDPGGVPLIDCADPDCNDRVCGTSLHCKSAECIPVSETNCGDGIDEDKDTLLDCADTVDCSNKSCGAGCICTPQGAPKETDCGDIGPDADNDRDTKTNCDDSDCATASCGSGCLCALGIATETNCQDTGSLSDNDSDGLINCEDTVDCNGKPCGASLQCVGAECVPTTELICSDGLDDDRDTRIDCEDTADCNAQSCGDGCVCTSAGTKKETLCNDVLPSTTTPNDNDGDGRANCADADCLNSSCGTGCRCGVDVNGVGVKVETICSDGISNDGDVPIDCADPDCAEQSCAPSRTCRNNTCVPTAEIDCGDGLNEDLDALTDCADTVDCNGKSCGAGCLCASGAATETDCQDPAPNNDNDKDGLVNCADSTDCNGKTCGAGCVCTFDGVVGKAKETNCQDFITGTSTPLDNDGDGVANCADTVDCSGLSCGVGCLCSGGVGTEINCQDTFDNDGDTRFNCVDSDCDNKPCAPTGCTCTGSRAVETICNDTLDNDGDMFANCADSDCTTKLCRASPSAFTCDLAGFCSCNGVTNPAPETSCADTLDNDCDGLVDCADIANCCGIGACAACAPETICNDGVDNDGDTLTDCDDPTCDNKTCGAGGRKCRNFVCFP
jgi:hypothetical protein